jgi:hypothetical protein
LRIVAPILSLFLTATTRAFTPVASNKGAICDHASSAELDLVPAPAFKITVIVIESRLPAVVIGTSGLSRCAAVFARLCAPAGYFFRYE